MPKTVIVLGGGIGGLSAAHELSERGFSVRVLERRDVPGGKARSVVVPSTAPVQNVGAVHLGRLTAPARRDLPGEHGFRFFPRFYKHIIDTMARTPYRGSRSVAENLVDTTGTIFARFGRRPLKLPTITPSTVPELFTLVNDLGALFGPDLGIAPEESRLLRRADLADADELRGAPRGRSTRRPAGGTTSAPRPDRPNIRSSSGSAAPGRSWPPIPGWPTPRRSATFSAAPLQPPRSRRRRRPRAQRTDQRGVDRPLAHVPTRAAASTTGGRPACPRSVVGGVCRP